MFITHTSTSDIGEVAARIRARFRSRILEWEHTSIMILWGMLTLSNPDAFGGAAFAAFRGGPALWGWVMLIAGVLRLVALCINGYMAQPTAMVRAFGAVAGILMFAAIMLGLLYSWTWPLGLAVYSVLGFFGLFSLGWAIFDVAIPDDHADATGLH